jgi:AbrB family looped-hinge helix DNA binding protein
MAEVLLQIRSNGQVTLPVSVQRQAHLKEGDTLAVIVESDGVLRLIPKILVDRTQAYFWTERWQAGEQEAQACLETDRVQRFDNVDDALAFLDKAK